MEQEVQQLKQQLQSLSNLVNDYKTKIDKLNETFKLHTHSGRDGSKNIDSEIDLQPGTPIKLGLGGMLAIGGGVQGAVSEQVQMSIVSGKDMDGSIGTSTNNLQLNLLHNPQNASNQSFITSFRPPVFAQIGGSTISVTATGTTVTVVGYNFATNSLAGALINIYNSSNTFIETQTIASNTATVITISGTWGATTTGGSFFILQPVFFGSADTPWQRLYTCEGTGAGIRFGVGVTAGAQNQNGLLYMDATGDLYWRNKSGSSTKLN